MNYFFQPKKILLITNLRLLLKEIVTLRQKKSGEIQMPQELIPSSYKQQFKNAIFIPLIIGLLMILSFVLEWGMDWDFHTAGVYPRRIENLWGIFTVIFVHADWSHLANNVISFILLGSCLYFF